MTFLPAASTASIVSWGSLAPLAPVAAATAVIYVFLIVIMRLFARRQLGQLSVIDLVVFLILGSAVETAMIHGNTSLAAGLVSASTLLATNRLLTGIFLRSPRLRHLVGGGPILLVRNGRVLTEQTQRAGLTLADVAEAVRARGYADVRQIAYAVLETDGTVSVIGG